mmetsp:Transcript_49427/g.148921  ORF Transcript_49427/g.148921 Transcript_49427/m.148921 type:complete len:268 (-) Transcript_49427:706-1509(-)|eukprot:CAMPEP_0113538928 /NCGR_PEP_ID=MMETSP0015_2-20120614/7639_1 /TAXON_ID=2838 /ORGANISM="Odontella" /LENGTH=267 /DNA_ID=CAMNT_0000438559 /DNA_START=161 /DNA_END=964 /DNA_ORIENTATION=- /assembly_acc=CAM_ASM_000160
MRSFSIASSLLVTAFGFSSPQTAQCFTPPSSFLGVSRVADTRMDSAKATTTRRDRHAAALRMGITLYGSQGSRSPLVNWGFYEMGMPLKMGDLSRNPHPFGQIPCLVDEDEDATVFESGAILNYLYSKADTGDSAKRSGAILSWIAWANASLDAICFLETPEGKVYDTGLKKPNRRIDALDKILAEKEFLVDGGFSLADVAVASYLLYVPQFFQGIDLSRWPNVVRYMKECAEREHYGEAFGPKVQQYLVGALDKMGGGEKKLFGMF